MPEGRATVACCAELAGPQTDEAFRSFITRPTFSHDVQPTHEFARIRYAVDSRPLPLPCSVMSELRGAAQSSIANSLARSKLEPPFADRDRA